MLYKVTNKSDCTRTIGDKVLKPGDHIYLNEPIKDGSLVCRRVEESEESEKPKRKTKKEVKQDGISKHVEPESLSNAD